MFFLLFILWCVQLRMWWWWRGRMAASFTASPWGTLTPAGGQQKKESYVFFASSYLAPEKTVVLNKNKTVPSLRPKIMQSH
jgi:hypothetical protein